jgi:hypothetical protein
MTPAVASMPSKVHLDHGYSNKTTYVAISADQEPPQSVAEQKIDQRTGARLVDKTDMEHRAEGVSPSLSLCV